MYRHKPADGRGGRHQVGKGNAVHLCIFVCFIVLLVAQPGALLSLHAVVAVGSALNSSCTLLLLLPLQESVKARHPQLLYESKLYKILQGGGEQPCKLVEAATLANCP